MQCSPRAKTTTKTLVKKVVKEILNNFQTEKPFLSKAFCFGPKGKQGLLFSPKMGGGNTKDMDFKE